MLFPEHLEDSGFDVIKGFSMLDQRFACARLSPSILDAVNAAPFDHDVHYRGF